MASKLTKFSAYLCLMRLMYKLGIPFKDRMSMKEFEHYEQKVQQSLT